MGIRILKISNLKNFDPNAAASKDSGIFGLPFTVEEATLVLIPVPWEVTTSYGGGTSKGPQAILQASKQVDLFDAELGGFFTAGIAMLEEPLQIRQWNDIARQYAQVIIEASSLMDDTSLETIIQEVNSYSRHLNQYVYQETKRFLVQDKWVGIVGGDHSVSLGAIQACLEKHPHMGILHFDAHADLRKAFEGFTYSHASIMYNVIASTSLSKLVQVGIRDLCQEEFELIQQNNNRISTFFDYSLSEQKLKGITWDTICDEIILQLPHEVYISFDIDGLDPRFCPHTGTPVPGGLEFNEALHLIKRVVCSGRQIIGFDLNEVSPGHSSSEWDANVGARLLYKLCGWMIKSMSS
ncbi:MAG: agmatinase [Gammaproteobacteria bacterium RIFCSPHIGHO2_12_FULL_41_20]|nr:MAG: agmatinase [Gammaproteobacteria bacterium RIFCSPHIGHO2_12_FULL_41_20]